MPQTEPPLATDQANAERVMLARLVQGEEDHEGLIAFALHRRAVFDWQDAYRAKHGRAPDDAALDDFLLGEQAERRIRDYRERASLMLALPPEAVPSPSTPPRPPRPQGVFRTWFWPWGTPAPFAPEIADKPLNWRGLATRLAILLLAVIVTAILLRFLVVRSIP